MTGHGQYTSFTFICVILNIFKEKHENVPGHVSLDIAFQDFAERFSRVNFDQRGYTRAPHIQPCKAFLARKNWNQLELVEQCREKKQQINNRNASNA